MPDSGQLGAADTPLRLLSSVHYLTDGELPQLYDYPDDGTWLRANFISSLDGGATVDGTSGAMAGPGDRFVFNLLRELADVIVVGVGTVRIEGYSGVRMGVVQRQHRQARGQSEVPQLAIVTRSGRLDRDMAVFTRTEMAPLVLTTTAVADDTRQRLAGLAEVIACSGDDPGTVDEAVLVSQLAARGLRRILTEGGPTLLGTFVERDVLDELCLTIAPYVVGGLARRIVTGPGQVADPDALCPCPHRRLRLPVHPLRQDLKQLDVNARLLTDPLRGPHRRRVNGYCGRHESAHDVNRDVGRADLLGDSAGRMRPGVRRRPAVRDLLGRRTARRSHHDTTAGWPTTARRTQERLVVARLHVTGVLECWDPSSARRQAGMRKL